MEVGIRNSRVLSNEEARFADLYRRHGKQLHAYCLRRTSGSNAADAVAETFLVAWKKIEMVPEGEAALAWLYAVAYRVLSHQWRHKARSRRLIERLSGLTDSEPPPPDVLLVRSEEYRMVVKASSRLKPIDQEILRLTLWEELSHADVGVVLGIEASAVKQRAYRARRNLAIEYQKLTKDRQPPTALEGGES
ncbi:MAG TPA: sigma-70 family RNA polymerase sigma factor [Acidimicrobiia bacterium]